MLIELRYQTKGTSCSVSTSKTKWRSQAEGLGALDLPTRKQAMVLFAAAFFAQGPTRILEPRGESVGNLLEKGSPVDRDETADSNDGREDHRDEEHCLRTSPWPISI